MQLWVNEIAQHKLSLTSGTFGSLLFFLPHGMCGRRQEKDDPALIVRKEQGAVRLRPTIYEVGTWDAVQEASLHWHGVTKIRCQSLHKKKKEKRKFLSVIDFHDLASRPVTASNLNLNFKLSHNVSVGFLAILVQCTSIKKSFDPYHHLHRGREYSCLIRCWVGVSWIIRMDCVYLQVGQRYLMHFECIRE